MYGNIWTLSLLLLLAIVKAFHQADGHWLLLVYVGCDDIDITPVPICTLPNRHNLLDVVYINTIQQANSATIKTIRDVPETYEPVFS